MSTTKSPQTRCRVPARLRWLAVSLALATTACGAGHAAAPAARPAVDAVPRAHTERLELVRRGRRAASAGDWIRAEQYYQAAVSDGAESVALTRMSIQASVRAHRYRAAAEHAQRHLQRHPEASEVRYLLATLHLGLSEPGRAFEQLSQLVRRDPEHALAHYALGHLHQSGFGDAARATAHYRRYLRLAPRGRYAARLRSELEPVSPGAPERVLAPQRVPAPALRNGGLVPGHEPPVQLDRAGVVEGLPR